MFSFLTHSSGELTQTIAVSSLEGSAMQVPQKPYLLSPLLIAPWPTHRSHSCSLTEFRSLYDLLTLVIKNLLKDLKRYLGLILSMTLQMPPKFCMTRHLSLPSCAYILAFARLLEQQMGTPSKSETLIASSLVFCIVYNLEYPQCTIPAEVLLHPSEAHKSETLFCF